MRNQYIEICGVSEQEIHSNLENEIHEFAAARGVTYDKLCAELRENYDGYHFTQTLSVYTIHSAFLMPSNIRNSTAIGLKRERLLTW